MIDHVSRAAMLEMRRKSVGASDSAAVLGLSRWKTALHVYLEKRGELPEGGMSEPARWGLMLEDVVAEAYRERAGVNYVPFETIGTRPDLPLLHACYDRIAVPPEGPPYPVELKTAREAGPDWGEEGTDQVPQEYLIQVQHQLLVSRAERADLAVLIGGQDFRVYSFRPSEAIHLAIVKAAADFWALVENADPPPPDYRHPSTLDLIQELHGCEGEVALDQFALTLARAYRGHKQAVKEHEDAADCCKAELIDRMGGAEVAHLPEGWRLTRRRVSRKGYEVGPNSYHTFYVKEPK